VLSRYLGMITILMFLALDGHLMVLELLANTFKSLPIGQLRFDPNAWNLIAATAAPSFSPACCWPCPWSPRC
jgi:flagellar biosynthetic protein FliR